MYWRARGRIRRSSIVAAVVLASGIGTGTAMFALMRVALLEKLPYPESDRLVKVWATDKQLGITEGGLSLQEYRQIVRRTDSLELGAYYSIWFPAVAVDEVGGQVKMARVSGPLFDLLGVAPAKGRLLTDGAMPYVVLGHAFLQRLSGGEAGVPEAVLTLDGAPYTAIGVMPRGFSFPTGAEGWAPAELRSTTAAPARDGFVIGRLKPGRELEELNTELETIAGSLPGWNDSKGLRGVLLENHVSSGIRAVVLFLFASVMLFFLISCSSAGQILFIENLNRQADFGIRVALGARPRDLWTQILGEAGMIAVAGTVGGALLAHVLVELSRGLIPEAVPRLPDVSINASVLAFMVSLGMAGASGVGWVSGWRLTRGEMGPILREPVGAGIWQASATRGALACVASAGTIFLAFSAVAVIAQLWSITHADLGFESRGVLTTRICIPQERRDDDSGGLRFVFDRIGESLRTVPGVRAVAIASGLPVGGYATTQVMVEGVRGYSEARVVAVSSDYFETLEIPIVQGRELAEGGRSGGAAAIVNEAFVSRFWPSEPPIGRQFNYAWNGGLEPLTVVGVVGDVRRSASDEGTGLQVYIPFFDEDESCGSLLVATDANGGGRLLQAHLWDLDARFSFVGVVDLESLLRNQNWRARLRSVILGVFGMLALTFGAVALYATLRQIVLTRKVELAVRSALGATRAEIVRLLLTTQAGPLGLGVGLGALGSLAGFRLLGASIYGVQDFGWLPLIVLSGILGVTGAVALLGPALSATRRDLVGALKDQ